VWLPEEVVVHEGTSRTGRSSGLPGSLIAIEPSELTWPGRSSKPGLGSVEPGEADRPDRPGRLDRSATEQEVAAARAPRFTPLPSESAASLGPPRIPGAGPHPGLFGTGPIPAVRAGQAEATPFEPREPAAAAASAGSVWTSVPAQSAPGAEPTGSIWTSVPAQPSPGAEPATAGTGPIPVFGAAEAGRQSSGAGTGPIPVFGAAEADQQSSGERPSPSPTPTLPDLDAGQLGSQDRATETRAPAGAKETWQSAADVRWPGQPPADAVPPLAAAWAGEQSADSRPMHSILGAPVAELRPVGGTFRTQGAQPGSAASDVIVPPAESLGEENRLPIFEAVESDWFRRGRPSMDWRDGDDSVDAEGTGSAWATAADEGWRAAEAAAMPASGGVTLAGLPRRVPQANLIPGTADAPTIPAPVRSAAATRERFASLQRGMREGRAASGIDRGAGTDDVPSDG
jgi:hypothetical protein